ncbi:phenylalanine ammonia-lyase, partial [Punctularia strigosozonata HHB-11173 SS5]|uniref:phenylalanine ammonia-lyase n=1 Tax=Punctularia strigosozonata (strain HHB-11173) TaxID=741275 RepID=UPI0004416B52
MHDAMNSACGLVEHVVDESKRLKAFRSGEGLVRISGHGLSIAAVSAVSRFGTAVTTCDKTELSASVHHAKVNGHANGHANGASGDHSSNKRAYTDAATGGDEAPTNTKRRVLASRRAIESKIADGKSVYGVTTGFGGSADTRTKETHLLGLALLQHQHAGILPVPISADEEEEEEEEVTRPLPLLDPLASTSMPEAWVRAAMVVRVNSLIRGHSAVRWELIERLVALLRANIVPLVPLRGSISASGDLSPLSYVAGTIIGNPAIRVWDGPPGARRVVSSARALAAHGLEPLALQPKEHLGVLNGTAFSAGLGALALSDAASLASLALVCTAMGVEALRGAPGSFAPFVHEVCRPHRGQVEAARAVRRLVEGSAWVQREGGGGEERTVEEDAGELRQDRYPLRTAAQWLGPQMEDVMAAVASVALECNSTTDNPLVDERGAVHHGGNFQATAVTNAMEKTRLAMHAIGKLMFAQMTEMLNPATSRGLPPSLAATDPSLNFHGKGLDIAGAAYVSELGYLAGPVSTHVQSAEMHNQAVNSLALISARATVDSVQVLSQLMASYLYLLCRAIDLRAMQADLEGGADAILEDELAKHFPRLVVDDDGGALLRTVRRATRDALDATTSMDVAPRMRKVAEATVVPILDHAAAEVKVESVQAFRAGVAGRMGELLRELREEYVKGTRSAEGRMGRTGKMYAFVRGTLGVRMHGKENWGMFKEGLGVEDVTVGENVSRVYEAIRDGQIRDVLVEMLG